MKKVFPLFLSPIIASALLLSGCSQSDSNIDAGTDPISDTQTTTYTESDFNAENTTDTQTEDTTLAKAEGVFYPPLSEMDIGYKYNGGNMLSSLLYYDGSMYRSSYMDTSENQTEITDLADSITGNELADIYSNNEVYWSDDSSKLFTFSENTTAKLYSMNGYDSSFRVCLLYSRYIPSMDIMTYGIVVFDRLNGITLNKGSELFKDRLHLDEYTEAYFRHPDFMNGAEKYPDKIITEDLSGFLDAVFEGEFVETDYKIREEFEKKKSYMIVFYTGSEISISKIVKVYPDGYVSIRGDGTLILEKIDQDACDNIIGILSGKEE